MEICSGDADSLIYLLGLMRRTPLFGCGTVVDSRAGLHDTAMPREFVGVLTWYKSLAHGGFG